MKKFLTAAIVAAFAFAAMADFSTANFKAVEAGTPAAVNAGTATTNAFEVSGYVGLGEILADYSAASTACVFTVTIEGTNTVDGGWATIATASSSGKTSGIVRVPFSSIYLPRHVRVIRAASGANATATSAVFLSR